MARREARRNCSTWRSSSGIARTAMVPACGLVMTARPSPLPITPRSASAVSAQKSLLLCVLIWLLSGEPEPLPEDDMLPLLPLLPLLLLLPLLPLLLGAPLPLTRTSLRPLRCDVG